MQSSWAQRPIKSKSDVVFPLVLGSFGIPLKQTVLEDKSNTEYTDFGRKSLKVCIFPPKLFAIRPGVGVRVCVQGSQPSFIFTAAATIS